MIEQSEPLNPLPDCLTVGRKGFRQHNKGLSTLPKEVVPVLQRRVKMNIIITVLITMLLSPLNINAQFDDTNWNIIYQENFDSNFVGVDGQKFGTDNWLLFQLINGGSITIENGYAQLNANDFQMAALIRSADILPSEYKVRTKIGYIHYDLANYEQADFDNTDFNSHGGYYENGMYFLTVTNDTCVSNECAEMWWHYHRKMVIDIDNHLDYGGGETFHPIYMVYMAPETNAGGNLLRTWDGTTWDESPWNWNAAATYDSTKWYYAELEKRNDVLILRLYDENQIIIEETTPVSLSKVFAMDDPTEYLYLGEPHTDDYEGNVRIDEITLFLYDSVAVSVGETTNDLPTNFNISQNYPNPFNPSTTIEYTLPKRSNVKIEIFNLLGQKIIKLYNSEQPAGSYQIKWNGKDENGQSVTSGIYLYRISTDEFINSKKMLLLK